MKTLSLMAAVFALGLTLVTVDAEAARRLGGGSSYGMQKRMSPPAKESVTSPTKAPAASAASTAPAAGAAQAQPRRSWMGPIAGLAAGLGLAALASHLGFGEGLASAMMIGLLVMAAITVVGLIMRRRAAPGAPVLAGAGVAQYARAEPELQGVPRSSRDEVMPGPVDADLSADTSRNIPKDFDVAGFERQAKVNFIRLQAANDAGNLDDLREFTTPEMFGQLQVDILERQGESQQTDVLEIRAEVLEVAEEASRYVVSVVFHGTIREEKDAPAESISEIWHLEKPRNGKTGWLLAGIQQIQ